MKILFVSNTNSLYGANRSMLELIKYLKAMGDDVVVLLPDYGGITNELEQLGCEYLVENYHICVRIGRHNALRYFMNILVYFRLLPKVRSYHIDLVHTNTSVLDIGACLAYALKVPHVWHVREMLEHYNMKYVIPCWHKKLRERSDGTIYISQYLLDNACKKYAEKNAHVIYNGFDISGTTTCKKTGHATTSINLLVCGMITENKGQAEAIEAVRILVKERGIQANLYVAGGGGSEQYVEILKQKTREYGIESNVHFLGFQKDLTQIRHNTDIALQCSRLEGMGRVTVESMLAGVIVVGAASGATAELITDGENGYLYEPGNCHALADRIEYIVNHPEERREIENRAKENAKGKFNSASVNKQIRALYKELLYGNKNSI